MAYPLITSRSHRIELLALAGFAEYQPVAVLPSTVVRDLPFRVDNRTLADLHDAIARCKTHRARRLDQLNVRPLVSVIMNVVGDLAKQETVWTENPP
jgi:hypothetical protein